MLLPDFRWNLNILIYTYYYCDNSKVGGSHKSLDAIINLAALRHVTINHSWWPLAVSGGGQDAIWFSRH